MLGLEMKHRVIGRVRHEWVIGTEGGSTDAKEFNFAMGRAIQEMRDLGVDLSFDDAYHVTSGEPGEVIVWVEIKGREEDEHARTVKGFRNKAAVSALLRIHREAHNEEDPGDHWPTGHCNRDGEPWPCETARICGVPGAH